MDIELCGRPFASEIVIDRDLALVGRFHRALAAGLPADFLDCFAPRGAVLDWPDAVAAARLPYGGLHLGRRAIRRCIEAHAETAQVLGFEAQAVTRLGTGRLLACGVEHLRFRRTGLETRGRWVHLFDIGGGRIATCAIWSDAAAHSLAHGAEPGG